MEDFVHSFGSIFCMVTYALGSMFYSVTFQAYHDTCDICWQYLSWAFWCISNDNAETVLFTSFVAGILKFYIMNLKCLTFIIQMCLELEITKKNVV